MNCRFQVDSSAGSAPRQGLEGSCFSKKGTNDTKPTHQPCTQSVAPGPEGRQKIAQRVSAGFRPPMHSQPRQGRQIPRFFTHRTATPRSDGFLTPASLKTQRRQDRRVMASGLRPYPFASLRLCVRPFGLNHRRMAAKITKRRKRKLFPSNKTAFLQRSHTRQTPPHDPHPPRHESLPSRRARTASAGAERWRWQGMNPVA